MLITPPPTTAERLEDLLPPALAARLDRLDVLSRKVFAGKMPGERRSKRRGQSVEFDDYREYTPGDDLRHVDWNVFARLDRFFIKLFREDEDLVVHLVVDASRSMLGGAGPARGGAQPNAAGRDDAGNAREPVPDKSLYARRLATALGYIGLVNQNRVIAETFGGPSPRRLAPVRGRNNLDRLAAFMLGAAPAPAADAATVEPFESSMARIARARSGQGVLIVLSDFLFPGELEKGLNYLAAGGGGGFDVTLLHLLAPSELDPSLATERGLRGDVRLTDIETGRAAEVTVSDALLKRYRARLDAHVQRLADAAGARGMRHALLSTDTPVERVVLDSLRRRRIVG